MARVLLVDDDDAVREILHWVLNDAGYEVEDAASAQAGMAMLMAAAEPLVVLFDYVMPDQTGEDLIRMAERDVPAAERHRFICCTASPTRLPPFLSTWLAKRSSPVLAKPFDVDALLTVVASEAALLPTSTSPS